MENILYQVRFSQRAKYLQMRLTNTGLEIVVPARYTITKEKIQAFIAEKKWWVKKHFHRLQSLQPLNEIILPTTIHLKAIDRQLSVRYELRKQKSIRLCETNDELVLSGDCHHKVTCVKLLRDWLGKVAAKHLSLELTQLALATGLTYARLKIRHNKTRWGSCSANKVINLSSKLLFLPKQTMHHVMLHELCHTKEMNHGKKFWMLLRKMDPLTKQHLSELKSAAREIPLWLHL